MIVADTDVLIDFLRGADAFAGRVSLELEHGLGTTAVTAFELWVGALGSKKRERAVETLLSVLQIVSFDAEDARVAASIRNDLQKKGFTMGMADSLIAGICVRRRAVLLTRNRALFEHVPGLSLSAEGR